MKQKVTKKLIVFIIMIGILISAAVPAMPVKAEAKKEVWVLATKWQILIKIYQNIRSGFSCRKGRKAAGMADKSRGNELSAIGGILILSEK